MQCTVLGLGRMGSALAGRLLEGGHQVTVWNRSPGRAGDLVARGAAEAASRADAVRQSELTLSSLANDQAVEEQALAEDGVLAHLPDGAVYVDCSTVSPALTAELARRFGTDRFAAMPVLGAPAAVTGGTATWLPGGDPAVLDRLTPVLEALGGQIRRFDRPERSSVAKVASNLLLLTGVVALAESFAVGRAGGLDDDDLRALLGGSPLVAPALSNRFEGILAGGQEPWWSAGLGAKDAGLAVEVGYGAGVDLPLIAAARAQLGEVAEALPDADIADVGGLYRDRRPTSGA